MCFRLWLPEFLGIWETVCNNPEWEQSLISLFSFVAWCNIGYIDWEPWLSRVKFPLFRLFMIVIFYRVDFYKNIEKSLPSGW
jgi:hypothetical protein